MPGGHEAVVARDAVEPRPQLALGELDDTVALRADEVMVVTLGAAAVAELTGPVGEDVDDTLVGEEPERPVDGREPEALAAGAQPLVEVLGGDVVGLSEELGEDSRALTRRTEAGFLEQALGPAELLGGSHGAMLAAVITRIVLTLVLAIPLSVAGCGGEDAGADGGRMDVVAGFYPLAFAAQEVGGDRVEVTNLTPAGAEPHDVELSVRDAERVRSADVVLFLGGGFQPSLEEAAGSAEGEAVDLLAGLDRVEGDPHVWLDPVRFAEVAERIGAELAAGASAARLSSRLGALDDEFRRGLADCERREVVTAHDAFAYLGERYELELIPIAGVSPEAEPSARDLEDVADLVRLRGATTVFVEPLLSPEVGETVARETGAETAVLDPLEGLTEEALDRGEDYFSVMRANLAALREGLGCR
jgi:zinc transport system substrate-binding protein